MYSLSFHVGIVKGGFLFFLTIFFLFQISQVVINSGHHHSGHCPLCTCVSCEDGSCDSCKNFKQFI